MSTPNVSSPLNSVTDNEAGPDDCMFGAVDISSTTLTLIGLSGDAVVSISCPPSPSSIASEDELTNGSVHNI